MKIYKESKKNTVPARVSILSIYRTIFKTRMKKFPPGAYGFFLFLHLFLSVFTLEISGRQNPDSPLWTQPLEKCWSYDAEKLSVNNIASDNEYLYLFFENKIKAISGSDGKLVWQSDFFGDFENIFLIKNFIVIQSNSTDSQQRTEKPATVLHFVRKDTGITEKILRFDIKFRQIQALNETEFLAADDRTIYKIDLEGKNLKDVWKQTSSFNFYKIGSDFAVIGFKANSTVEVFKITPENASENLKETDKRFRAISKIQTEETPAKISLDTPGEILLGGRNGLVTLHRVEPSKKLWSFKTGGEITEILANSQNYFVFSKDNFVYSLNKKGKIQWRLKLPGRLFDALLFEERFLAARSLGSSEVLLIDASDGRVFNRISFENDINNVEGIFHKNEQLIFSADSFVYSYSPKCPRFVSKI